MGGWVGEWVGGWVGGWVLLFFSPYRMYFYLCPLGVGDVASMAVSIKLDYIVRYAVLYSPFIHV